MSIEADIVCVTTLRCACRLGVHHPFALGIQGGPRRHTSGLDKLTLGLQHVVENADRVASDDLG